MVHKRTAQLYKEAGIEYPLTTEDFGLLGFERETRNSPKSYRIDQIYRVKHIDRDYIIYNQTIISRDHADNRRTATETVGTHLEPQFQKRFDQERNEHIPIAVDTSDVIYDIPATKENIEAVLNGTYHQRIGEEKSPRTIVQYNTNFVLQNGNQKFGDFTRDEFVNRHFDDLLFKATNGYYPRQLKPFGDSNVGNNNEAQREQANKEHLASEGTSRLVQQAKDSAVESVEREEKARRMEEQEQIIQPQKNLLVTPTTEEGTTFRPKEEERDELNPYAFKGEPITSEKPKPLKAKTKRSRTSKRD